MEDIIIIGYGGHAKSVADCIERQKKFRIVGYTDSRNCNSKYKYLGTDDVLEEYFEKGVKKAAVGIGYLGKGSLREKVYNELKRIGYELPIITDPSAVISESASLGEGVFIGKGCIVNSEAKIGKMAIVNTKALIEHESIIHDFCHVAVGAVICGQVEIGKAAFVGANATVIQCMNVEERKVIPAGMTVR